MADVRIRPGLGALVALLVVAGCNVPVTPSTKKDKPPARAATAESPLPAASAQRGEPASRAPRAASLLQAPAGASARLRGTVSIDASYMVAAGAGNVLSPNGSPIVAAGAGNLIGADGASLVGPDGASLVAAGAGNIVAAGGLNLIGADGASLVGADGASFRLAQAPAAAPAPPLGEVLPAAAMRVGLIDLRDGKPLPVGVDADGKPVYTVYSNLKGQFELFVPAALAGYVRIAAEAPGRADARLRYDTIVRADEDPDDIDEDTARVGRFLRSAFAIRFEQLMSMSQAELQSELEAERPLDPTKPEFFHTFAKPMLIFFGELSRRRGFPLMDPVKRRAIAQTAADRLLAECDFSNVTTADVQPGYTPKDPNERALDAFRDAMKRIRTDVGPLLAAAGSESFSARLATLSGARRPDGTPYQIVKPADLTAFIVQAYLADQRAGADIGPEADTERMHKVNLMLEALGILAPEDRAGRMSAAGRAVTHHMLYVFKFKDNPDPHAIEYGPVGQGIIDYLWDVETGVATDLGRPSPGPAPVSGEGS